MRDPHETRALPTGSFVRSALVSALATGTDFALASLLSRAALGSSLATFVGSAAGGLVAFAANRGWAFRSRGKGSREVVRFLAVWATSALLNASGVGWLTRIGLTFSYAWVLTRVLVYSAWNYPLLRWFVFRRVPGFAR